MPPPITSNTNCIIKIIRTVPKHFRVSSVMTYCKERICHISYPHNTPFQKGKIMWSCLVCLYILKASLRKLLYKQCYGYDFKRNSGYNCVRSRWMHVIRIHLTNSDTIESGGVGSKLWSWTSMVQGGNAILMSGQILIGEIEQQSDPYGPNLTHQLERGRGEKTAYLGVNYKDGLQKKCVLLSVIEFRGPY